MTIKEIENYFFDGTSDPLTEEQEMIFFLIKEVRRLKAGKDVPGGSESSAQFTKDKHLTLTQRIWDSEGIPTQEQINNFTKDLIPEGSVPICRCTVDLFGYYI